MKFEETALDLNQSEFDSENDLKEYLSTLILCYTSKMNSIEMYINNKAEESEDKYSDIFKEYGQLYEPIFNAFVSDKKRVYGGKANSFGYPTKFDGIEEYVEKEVSLKTKNRAEVIFRTNNQFQAAYQFIVIRKNKEWRIDNVKYSWYLKDKWKPLIL